MTTDQYVLDDDGNPVPEPDLLAWAIWHETANRQLAYTRVANGDGGSSIEISTIFLGLDRSINGRAPILWETMVLGGPMEGRIWRYASRDEALAGHERACSMALGVVPR